jgi:hypothetical protein
VIKEDFMPLINCFGRGDLNIARLNYANIIWTPKEDEARTLKKFKAISLINYSFKVFSKAMNNRLELVCDKLLSSNQIAFVRGRCILESVVSVHEIIHHTIKKKEKGLLLKLDYEKAHDRVS